MKRPIRFTTILQLLFCVCCLMVGVFMYLYHLTYKSAFGRICFQIGAVLTIINLLNPIGLICGGIHISDYTSQKRRGALPDGKFLLWVIVGPILTTICWLLSIASFVWGSGGV